MSDSTTNNTADVKAVTDADFQAEVLDSREPVLVDFWAPWCGPCRMLAPTLEDLAAKYAGKVKVRKLNVDENQKTARDYGIMSIPSVMLFKGGEAVDNLVGVQPPTSYEAAVDRVTG